MLVAGPTDPVRLVATQFPALGTMAAGGVVEGGGVFEGGALEAGVIVKLSVTLFALLDSLRRYRPAVIGFDPNRRLAVIV